LELEDIREVAQGVAGSMNKNEARVGSMVIGILDDFISDLDPRMIKRNKGVDATQLGQKYSSARSLWGRARKAETIQEAFEKARNQASGFENGIRTQFRSILNNKKKSKFFTKDELKTMQQVVRGTGTQNILKLLGKFGFGEGQATGMLGGSIGVGAGAAFGGPVGAVAVPVVGQTSRKLAQIMTRKGAEFTDAFVRAGKNGRKIVEAYIRNTPRAQRSSAELAELLMDADLSRIPKSGMVNEAKLMINQRRAELAGALSATQAKEN
jgi:hypothetical protein